jgi:integrase
MSVLETIYHQPMIYSPLSPEAKHGFIPKPKSKLIKSFPQIYSADGEPWKEANQYAFSRFYDLRKKLKTVSREMSHIARYADWLEKENIHWLHFPKKKRERCLFRFKGFLIECRENHHLAPSTVSAVMNSTLNFYRWASREMLAQCRYDMWEEKAKTVKFFDRTGFSRTMNVMSSELSIPNRRRTGVTLEDGLLPLNKKSLDTLMLHLTNHSNYELYLFHKVAIQTGCRYETISTLTSEALKSAYQDPNMKHIMRVSVGPSTAVKTKFDVSGSIMFPQVLLQELVDYYDSAEAILRRSKASNEHQKNIFLTSRGNLYTRASFSTIIGRLRAELVELGYTEFGRFKFHQLRATFGTMTMEHCLNSKAISNSGAIEFVKDAMLHKDASTTWKYVTFINNVPQDKAFYESLWAMFTGSVEQTDELVEGLTGRYDG